MVPLPSHRGFLLGVLLDIACFAWLAGAARDANDALEAGLTSVVAGKAPARQFGVKPHLERVEVRPTSMLHREPANVSLLEVKDTRRLLSNRDVRWSFGGSKKKKKASSSAQADPMTDLVVKPWKLNILHKKDPWLATLKALPKKPVFALGKQPVVQLDARTAPFASLKTLTRKLKRRFHESGFCVNCTIRAAREAQLQGFAAQKELAKYLLKMKHMKNGTHDLISDTYTEQDKNAEELKEAYTEATHWQPDDLNVPPLPEVARNRKERDKPPNPNEITALSLWTPPTVEDNPIEAGKWDATPLTYCSKSALGTVAIPVPDDNEGFTLSARQCEDMCKGNERCKFYTHGQWLKGTYPGNLIIPGHYGQSRCQLYEKCEEGELDQMTLFTRPARPEGPQDVPLPPGVKYPSNELAAAPAKELYKELLAVEPAKRKSWFKRTGFLKWHPDKCSTDDAAKCTAVFQFLNHLGCPGKLIPGVDCDANKYCAFEGTNCVGGQPP